MLILFRRLSNNTFTGSLPGTLNELENIKEFFVEENQFSASPCLFINPSSWFVV
jgi:hypothetical protein